MDELQDAVLMKSNMTRIEHLEELRWMLIRSLGITAIGFIIGWHHKERILQFITEPLLALLPQESQKLIFTTLAEGFICYLWMSLIAGIIITSPFWFYQLWEFIKPAFYVHEKTYATIFVGVSSVLFISGAIGAYQFVFPIGFKFFLTFSAGAFAARIRLADYLQFSSQLLLAFGIVLETPLVLIALTKMGTIDPTQVARQRKYVVIIILIVAAVLTPPDVATQMMMAIPLLMLFEISLVICKRMKKWEKLNQKTESK